MPSPIDRSKVSHGPALLIFNMAGVGVFKVMSEGDVTEDYNLDSADQDSAAYGVLASFRTGLKPTIACKPIGVTTLFPLLNAFAGFPIGRSLIGAKVANVWTDNTLIVQPLDTAQDQTTFYGVAPTSLMDSVASAVAGLFDGTLTFTAAGKNNTAQNAANRVFLKAANANLGSGYDPATLIRVSPDVEYSVLLPPGNGGAVQTFSTRAGAKLALGLATAEHLADGVLWDVSFKSLSPVVTLSPVGIDEAAILDVLGIQGAGSEVGTKLADTGAELNISGPGLYIRLPLAGVRKGSLVYGSEADRAGDLEFVAARDVGAGGTVSPLFYIGTQAPA